MLTEVKINSVDYSSYLIRWEYIDINEDRVCNATVVLNANATLPEINDTITIKRGEVTATDEFLFKGYITKITQSPRTITLVCKDMLYDAIRQEVTRTFLSSDTEAGKISEIFKTLINDYTGLQADATSVQDSGTINILDKFVCNKADVFDKLKELSDILQWQFYYDPVTDLVYFEPKGYTVYATTLTVGSGGNVNNVPIWEENSDELVNYVRVIGAKTLVGASETFTTNGVLTEFQLNFIPVNVTAYTSTDNGVTWTEKKGGVSGVSEPYDYSVDDSEQERKVIFNTAPATSTPGVKVEYVYNVPMPVIKTDSTSIINYGEVRKTFYIADIKTLADAEIKASQIIDEYSEPFLTTTLKLGILTDINAGDTVVVDDNINNRDETVVVTKMTKTYPHFADTVEVGDRQVRTADFEVDILKKIRKLQEDMTGKEELTLTVTDLTRDIDYERRDMVMEKRDLTTAGVNIFILGDLTFGKLGTQKLGDSTGLTYSTIKILQGENTLKELFYDTRYKAAATTGTWDTTNKQLILMPTQIGQSSTFYKDTTNVTKATLTVTADSIVDLALKLSADGGSHWESVTNAVQHTFSTAGQDVRWQITNNAAGGSGDEFPLAFPINFDELGGAATKTITKIEVAYVI